MRGENKSTEQLSIDDLLERQKQAGGAATIEAVENKPSLVKVTPWVAGVGCLCQFAIEVPKSAIEHVSPTGEKHNCCGKVLTVVEVKFKDKSEVTLAEVFSQLSERAAHASSGESVRTSGRVDYRTPGADSFVMNCEALYDACIGKCYGDPLCLYFCNQSYRQCVNPRAPRGLY